MMPMVCSIEKDGTYRSGDLVMLPRPVERVLVNLYYRFEADRLLDVIFHESGKPTLQWFLATYLKPETSTLISYRESAKLLSDSSFRVDETYYTPLGMVWINQSWAIGPNFRKAECGMAFVRRTPLEDTLRLGEMSISWAFDNLALDSLFGCTPSPNRAAVLFGQKLGFQQTTPLEGYSCFNGKLCSVVLQSMTKERWHARTSDLAKEAA
jgi:hypothetical protein